MRYNSDMAKEKMSGAQKGQRARETEDDFAYYLTLFKMEGHTSWRAQISGHAGGFDREWNTGKHPNVTAKKILRIDRKTAQIEVKKE